MARQREPRPQKTSTSALLKDAYHYLTSTTGEHPIDVEVGNLRDVVLARRKMRRASARLQSHPGQPALFVAYEDAWSNYNMLRDEQYFNRGFEFGARFAPLFRDSPALVHSLRPLLRELQTVRDSIPDHVLAGGLMEMARAFLLADAGKNCTAAHRTRGKI
jgi:hypothetical protein